jgi:hypothetical protein
MANIKNTTSPALYAAVQLVDNTFFIIVGPFALPVGANI